MRRLADVLDFYIMTDYIHHDRILRGITFTPQKTKGASYHDCKGLYIT